jgi:hypothetical protein
MSRWLTSVTRVSSLDMHDHSCLTSVCKGRFVWLIADRIGYMLLVTGKIPVITHYKIQTILG